MSFFNAIPAITKLVLRVQQGAHKAMPKLQFQIETEREVDGRWIAEMVNLPGVLSYGMTKDEVVANAEVIALRLIADRIDQSKVAAEQISFACA